MTEIKILNNKKCQIISDNLDLLKKLRKHLSYQVPGYQYSPAFTNGFWDGMQYLMDKKGKFPVGLLNTAINFIKDQQIDVKITDLRPPLKLEPEIDLTVRLQEINKVPRDYQQEIVNIAAASRNGIVRAGTSSGKTLCCAMLAAKLNKPTIIYVIGIDLLKQFHDTFTEVFKDKEEIGYIGDGVCKIGRITIATIWSVSRALNSTNLKNVAFDEGIGEKEIFKEENRNKILQLLKESKVAIFDECHIANQMVSEICKSIDPDHVYGFSGTPFKDQKSDIFIKSILGDQLINISASFLIDKGILPKPIIKWVKVPKKSLKGTYQEVYKEYIVENEERNKLVLDNAKWLLVKGYTPLVLFKTIAHGKYLFQLFKDAGVNCELLFGEDKLEKRLEIKNKLLNKEIDCLIASTILDIGVSIDVLSGLVLAGGGGSDQIVSRCIQRVGRLLRKHPGKNNVIVVDFFDDVKYLKQHSKNRNNTYLTEPAFKVIPCSGLK